MQSECHIGTVARLINTVNRMIIYDVNIIFGRQMVFYLNSFSFLIEDLHIYPIGPIYDNENSDFTSYDDRYQELYC